MAILYEHVFDRPALGAPPRGELVGAENPIRPAHATSRYS